MLRCNLGGAFMAQSISRARKNISVHSTAAWALFRNSARRALHLKDDVRHQFELEAGSHERSPPI